MASAERSIATARYETRDIGEGFIWLAVASMAGLLLACAALTWWLYPQARADRASHLRLAAYPAPRLQANPPADMRALYAQEMQRLDGAGGVDEAHGTAHIPIAEAMRQVVEEGIPGWPRESGGDQ